MKARVMAGLKWEPEMRALKMSRMKKPLSKAAMSNLAAAKSAVTKHVPRNSKRRMRKDSLKVYMKSLSS